MKKNNIMVKITILLISVVQMGTNAISPVLSDIASAFPDASASTVQFLMTFPSLMVLFFSLISSVIAEKVAKKYISSFGCFLFCISGLLSFLMHDNLVTLFVFSGLMGIGIGLVVTMALSLVSDCFEGEERQNMMGLQSTAANFGAMAMTFASGILGAIHWHCSYLVYFIALPGAILSLMFLPKVTQSNNEDKEIKKAKSSLLDLVKKSDILLCCLMALLVTLLFNTIPTNLSMLLQEKGIGNAAQAGTAVTLLLLSGAIGGMAYGPLSKHLNKFTMVFGFTMLAIGQLICLTAGNIVFVYVGCLIGGCAISTVMPQVTLDAAAKSDGNTSGSSALVMAASNLGGFCAPFITILAKMLSGSNAVSSRFVLSVILGIILIVFLSIFLSRKQK